MAVRFKLMPMDFVSVTLTLLASVFTFVGFFADPWWTNSSSKGKSYFGMMSYQLCEVGCREKPFLHIEEGMEWIFSVRVFEVFGLICLLLALVFALLMVVMRKKVVHTSLIYTLGAAALFVLLGVFIFLGCKSSLEDKVEGNSSLVYAFALCLVGAVICIGASIVAGFSLRKHLLDFDDFFDDDDGDYAGDYVEAE